MPSPKSRNWARVPGQPVDPGIVANTGVPEAPPNFTIHGRRGGDASWQPIPPSVNEAPNNAAVHGRQGNNQSWQPVVTEAPNNGTLHARRGNDTSWQPVPAGIPEAPNNATLQCRRGDIPVWFPSPIQSDVPAVPPGSLYVRQAGGTWVILPPSGGIGEAPSAGQTIHGRRGSDSTWQPAVSEAPPNPVLHGRHGGTQTWQPIPEGIEEAPNNANLHARVGATQAWEEIENELPDGGTTGQVLAKASDADADIEWRDEAEGMLEAPNNAIIHGRRGNDSTWQPAVNRAGDDGLTGTHAWLQIPATTQGVSINSIGGVRLQNCPVIVEDSTIIGDLYQCSRDGSGYVFGRLPGQNDGGLWRPLGRGIALRQSSGNERPEIETNDGTQRWIIIDARGGMFEGEVSFRKAGTGGGIVPGFLWFDEASNIGRLYASRVTATGLPALICQAEGPGGMATVWRVRTDVDPPRMEITGAPIGPLDAVNREYVDGLVTGSPVLIGLIDASTGDCRFTPESGFPDGPLPDADQSTIRDYVVCTNSGTIPSGPAQGIVMDKGDWLYCTGTEWLLIDIADPTADVVASNVNVVPPVFSADNVQTALENASDLIDDKIDETDADDRFLPFTGGTLTGRLVLADDPLADLEPVTRRFYDANTDLDALLPRDGSRPMTGPLTLDGLPLDPNHATTRAYVDSLVSGSPVLIGMIDASTGDCIFIPESGFPNGPLPDADASTVRSYVVCIEPGTIPGGPAAGIELVRGDWLYCTGTVWLEIPLGNPTSGDPFAINVRLAPPVFGSANVQGSLANAEVEVRNRVGPWVNLDNYQALWTPNNVRARWVYTSTIMVQVRGRIDTSLGWSGGNLFTACTMPVGLRPSGGPDPNFPVMMLRNNGDLQLGRMQITVSNGSVSFSNPLGNSGNTWIWLDGISYPLGGI